MPAPLALTLGEPAGIGPDVTLSAWQRRAELELPPFYVLADPGFLERLARRLGLAVPVATVEPGAATTTFARALPVVPLALAVTAAPGRPDESSAPAAIAAITRAVADTVAGR
ncbi:MAG TPA: 4-hydroxythreonine-4-phosphate dehydrogenase, partial [Xanthobacteraceae bacterium]|nr:4-hydroxythreonine-4-phosphate dehydrogenase [Xanthobacteraceae bacterium]